MSVSVIDGVCGMGKTHYIKEQIKAITGNKSDYSTSDPKVIFATPYRLEAMKMAGIEYKYNVTKKQFVVANGSGSPSHANNEFEFEFQSNVWMQDVADEAIIKLINQSVNIVCTHSTLALLSIDTIHLLKQHNYHLIIDETPSVIEKIEFDGDYLEANEYATLKTLGVLDEGKDGEVNWVLSDSENLKRYNALKQEMRFGRFFRSHESAHTTGYKHVVILKEIYTELFTCPLSTTVYTYLFEGTYCFAWLKYNSIPFAIENWTKQQLIDNERIFVYDKLINLYEPRGINSGDFGSLTSFSSNWYASIAGYLVKHIHLNKQAVLPYFSKYGSNPQFNPITELSKKINSFMVSNNNTVTLSKEGVNYFQDLKAALSTIPSSHKFVKYINQCLKPEPLTSDDKLWTTFKRYMEWCLPHHTSSKAYTADHFLAFNTKATNDYSHAKRVAYSVNVFAYPDFIKYFSSGNKRGKVSIKIDGSKYATSELIQWVFRSRIRNGEKISLFITSSRMRTLMKIWMKDMEHIRDIKLDKIINAPTTFR